VNKLNAELLFIKSCSTGRNYSMKLAGGQFKIPEVDSQFMGFAAMGLCRGREYQSVQKGMKTNTWTTGP